MWPAEQPNPGGCSGEKAIAKAPAAGPATNVGGASACAGELGFGRKHATHLLDRRAGRTMAESLAASLQTQHSGSRYVLENLALRAFQSW